MRNQMTKNINPIRIYTLTKVHTTSTDAKTTDEMRNDSDFKFGIGTRAKKTQCSEMRNEEEKFPCILMSKNKN